MAQNLEFSATSGLTLTATAYSIGTYSGGTNANSVTQQAGTNRYLALFSTNLTAGAYRLDYLVSGTCIGNEVYDVDGSGTYQPRSEKDLTVQLDEIQSQTDLITQAGIVAVESTSENIKIKVASTKTKRHNVSGDLTGKTLKLYVESKPGVFFDEYNATGGDGYFEFTPDAALTASVRTFFAACREPSDGNYPHWDGLLEVAYAADAE